MLDRFTSISSVDVLEDGVVIDPTMGDGRPIPSLVVDARLRPDVREYILAHKSQPPGDVTIQWAVGFMNNNEVFLIIKSERPTKVEFSIRFYVDKHDTLIDAIIHAKALYLQTGMPGDKVSHLMQDGKISIEVGYAGFEQKWNKLLSKATKRRFKQKGLNRKQSDSAAKDYIRSMREFWALRKNA
ncbi:hypothetical protein D5Q54_18195 [Vibrio cholerae]|nr:hypothetical protein [Vibrio cholerae]